jgi:hypothetical protein
MLGKVEMKKLLKGMSPDLTDNIILMCGSMAYDCYRILRDDTGVTRSTLAANDMLSLLGVNSDSEMESQSRTKPKIKVNNDWVLNILSTI